MYGVYPVTMDDETDDMMPLINRIYYMAREGMSMALYAFLSGLGKQQVDSIINQVNI